MLLLNKGLWFVFLFGALNAFQTSQSVEIDIQVIDYDLEGLPFANIEFKHSDTLIIAQSDFDGFLKIQNFKKGMYAVSISGVLGYLPFNDSLLIDESGKILFTLSLDSSIEAPIINWSGGIVTFIDKEGNFRCVKSKEK